MLLLPGTDLSMSGRHTRYEARVGALCLKSARRVSNRSRGIVHPWSILVVAWESVHDPWPVADGYVAPWGQ